jgi:hypothetical protein
MIYAFPGAAGAKVVFKAKYDNFIGGKFVAPVKGQYFDVITPVTGKVYTQAARSSAEDIELALDAAHAAADAAAKALIPAVGLPVVVREADPSKDGGRKEVAFVDTSVADYKALEAGIRDGVAIVEIDGTQSGLAQMAVWAQANQGYDAIHVLAHGAEADQIIGTDQLTLSSLGDDVTRAELAEIGSALKAGGDLLLYGCEVGAGTAGQALLSGIAQATGADVAASTDVTGIDGNWDLERVFGTIDVAGALAALRAEFGGERDGTGEAGGGKGGSCSSDSSERG